MSLVMNCRKVNLEGKCNEKTANRNVRGQAGHEQEMRSNDANCMSLPSSLSPAQMQKHSKFKTGMAKTPSLGRVTN